MVISTVGSIASVGIAGLLSAGASSIGAPFSVPLGSSMNLGFNQFAFPWVMAILPLAAPGDTGIFATVITQFAAGLLTTINNLLAG